MLYEVITRVAPSYGGIYSDIPLETDNIFPHLFLSHLPDARQLLLGINSYRKIPEVENTIEPEHLPIVFRLKIEIGL